MREVIIGILNVEEMNARTKFSETENVYKAEFPSMYQNMGELIRCKDCKHYERWTNHKICMLLGSYYGNTQPHDYCSNAERKEE